MAMDDQNGAAAPDAFYQRARADLAARLIVMETRDRRLADARLAVFVAGAVCAWGAWRGVSGAVWGLAACVAGFIGLVVFHAVVRSRLPGLKNRLDVIDEALARLGGRWAGKGLPGDGLAPAHHPYAEDLDIVGPGSLFELMCTCRTRLGEEQLAQYLLNEHGVSIDEAQDRGEAVRELARMHALRLAAAAVGRPTRVSAAASEFLSWAELPERFAWKGWRVVVAVNLVLAAITVGIAVWAEFYAPMVILFAVNMLVLGALKNRTQTLERWAEGSGRHWGVLAELLVLLEEGNFECARLKALQGEVVTGGLAASAAFRRLDTLAYMLQMPANQFFMPIAILTLWPLMFGLAVEAWRRQFGPHFPAWLKALGEFEGLCSLGTFAFEHPTFVVPEWSAETQFTADGLAHPLLPERTRVANDLRLGAGQHLLIVSGSNMSGKSTLMRSIGINAVLAMAGAPVCARSLALSPLALGATMRVHDSIQEGASRFYAEVLRLRQLLDLSKGGRPLLFLCDEILHGTNSHDRLEGARALMKTFRDNDAIGAMTTHDLALTQLAGELRDAVNVHLQDEFDGDQLVFDYQLRPGVVGKSNALALMRGAGLPI